MLEANPVSVDLITMTAKNKKPTPRLDDREIVIVLKDNRDYRLWFDGLSDATLIAGASIVRDALSKWAAARGLPAPPPSSGRRHRR